MACTELLARLSNEDYTYEQYTDNLLSILSLHYSVSCTLSMQLYEPL